MSIIQLLLIIRFHFWFFFYIFFSYISQFLVLEFRNFYFNLHKLLLFKNNNKQKFNYFFFTYFFAYKKIFIKIINSTTVAASCVNVTGMNFQRFLRLTVHHHTNMFTFYEQVKWKYCVADLLLKNLVQPYFTRRIQYKVSTKSNVKLWLWELSFIHS